MDLDPITPKERIIATILQAVGVFAEIAAVFLCIGGTAVAVFKLPVWAGVLLVLCSTVIWIGIAIYRSFCSGRS